MAFSALVLLGGLGLRVVGGPPRLPSELPNAAQLVALLAGSTLPMQPLALLAVDLAWLVWAWIVASFGIQALLLAAEGVARGSLWVRSVRQIADRLTLPLARQAVAAAFAVHLLSRSVSVAAAAPVTAADVTLVAQANPGSESPDFGSVSQPAATPKYVVKRGDTLWSIADQVYGSGSAYRRLVDANVGHRMIDGQVFGPQGVIQPGWELVVPGPLATPQSTDLTESQDWYTVEADDTLSAIAASTLGDEQRWPDLFEANRGAVSSDGRHALADPDLIWPGLRLRVPARPQAGRAAPTPAETDQVAAGTVASPATPQPVDTPAGPSLEADPTPAGLADQPAGGVADRQEAATPDTAPLLRTAHALDPIVLEPSDLAVVAPDDASSAPNPEGTLPTPPPAAEFPAVPLALGGVGMVALGGMVFGARRVRRLRPLPQEPETEVVVEGGFAEAQLTHDLTRGLHGVGFDPLVALVAQIQQFLDEYDLGHVTIVAARHGRSATTVALAAGLAEQPLLVDLAHVFGSRLDSQVEASVTPDQDVVWRVVRLRRTRLLPAAIGSASADPCLVPLGVLYDRQVYTASWRTLGHVLVASLAGHGADTILTSLVATLSARRSPAQLKVWMIAPTRALPAPLFELPHLARCVDPADDSALLRVIGEIETELERRAVNGFEDDVVVVIPELTQLGEHAANLEMLSGRAATLGVRFIAATSSPDAALASPMMSHFSTRLVLRMRDEESSVALLGVADAAFLGGGGRLLLRLDGREPVELYGYQVAAEHLERLVRVMRSAYPAVGNEPGPPEPMPVEPPSPPPSASAILAPSAALAPTPETPDDAPPPQPIAKPTSTDLPAIHVICFGGPRIMCAGQQVWPKLGGGEVKPWEFLLYLACQPADGVASEQAVQAMWPEDDEADNAPHRFRQLRYRLRRLLHGVPGAPHIDGIYFERGTLRLDPGVVYSDAQEFLELVRSARINSGHAAIEQIVRARGLYVADLLEGPDARRYAWLDERDDSGVTLREHFRKLFQNASLKLAELYVAHGELESGLAVYRELSEADPADERLWRAVFRLHAERGDRLALVREERRMREALRELAADFDEEGSGEFEEPSRELAKEYQRLLAGLRDADREAATA